MKHMMSMLSDIHPTWILWCPCCPIPTLPENLWCPYCPIPNLHETYGVHVVRYQTYLKPMVSMLSDTHPTWIIWCPCCTKITHLTLMLSMYTTYLQRSDDPFSSLSKHVVKVSICRVGYHVVHNVIMPAE